MPEKVILDRLEIEADVEGVLRYLGYPASSEAATRIRERVEEAIRAARGALRPRGTYSLYPVISTSPDSLTLEGNVTFRGEIGEFLGQANRAAVFVGTAGPEIVAMAEAALSKRDIVGGMAFDALGSWLAEAAVEKIVEDLSGRLQPGESLTLCFSPGYCGVSLAQQRLIFRLVDAAAVGVELLPTLIMKPVKSVSGLIGIGPAQAVKAYGNPCDRCPELDCKMRRAG